jgi:magnesium-transporting ATPase (P-type)
MRENKFLTYLAEFIITFLVAGILVMLFLSFLPGCRSLRAHKETSTKTIDSVHLVKDLQKNGIHTDSTVHSDKKDTAGKHTVWSYDKETTTTTDYFLPGTRHPDTLIVDNNLLPMTNPGQLVARSTTVVRERGNQDITETRTKTAVKDLAKSATDTSTHQVEAKDQVQRSESKTVSDKKVKSLPWWLVPLAVLVCFGVIYFNLSPGQVGWILALFRRRKQQDNS